MPFRTVRAAHLLRAAALAAVLAAPAAAARTAPDYSGFTAARFIPFETDGPPLQAPPMLRFAIEGSTYEAAMDTGSTGIMLTASKLPGYTPTMDCANPPADAGREFLSSSNRLWVGRWIEKEIDFLDASGGVVATASVPVLAVECETVCGDYDRVAAPPTCPGQRLGAASPRIHYMGVGFGREHDSQPQGTPDKNPLLNIVRIDGVPVRPGTMRSGYIVTPQGVHVGLTAANTSGFVYTRLTGPKYSSDPRDWPQASICVAVDGSACFPGSVLVDTGIPQMYLTVPPNVPVKTSQPSILAEGSRVTVRFPGDPDAMAFYSFVVGQQNPMAPAHVVVSSGDRPFVNTGSNFLHGFDVLFDADGGLFGLRWTGPAGSTDGGLVPPDQP